MSQMTLSAPLIRGRRLIFVVYANDVFYRASVNASYSTAGPVASVLLGNVTSSDAPGRIELITSQV